MTNNATDPARNVWVATDNETALIRISGRASFAIGPSLKELGTMLMEKNYKWFVLDLKDCNGVDSTFLGVLAGIASRMTANEKKMIMINLNPLIHETVITLGLDRIIESYETEKAPSHIIDKLGKLGEMAPVEINKSDSAATRATAIEAHEALIESDKRNLSRFKDVLTFLRETSRT